MQRPSPTIVRSLLAGGVLTLAVLWLDGYRTAIIGEAGESYSPGYTPAKPHETYTATLEQLCVDGKSDVTVTDVRPRYATEGVEIVDFAIGAPEIGRGMEAASLTQYLDTTAFGTNGLGKNRELENLCPSDAADPHGSRPLVVTFKLGAQVPAYVAGIEVDYRVRGLSRTASFSNGAGFCRGDESTVDGGDEEESVASELGIPEEEVHLAIYTCP